MDRPRRPTFARELPETPELDALVDAFARGDYGGVRMRAARLEQSSADPAIRKAARTLVERTRPDPLAVVLLIVAALLLATMSSWWVAHGRPPL